MGPNSPRSACSGLAALLLACWCVSVSSHGFLLKPMSRQYYGFLYDDFSIRNWSPGECNSGGPKAVSDGGKLRWPARKFSLCGDPADKPKKSWDWPRNITETYKVNDTIEVHQLITANHWGRMEIRVCPLNATAADYESTCTTLERADGKGIYWTLPPGVGLDEKKRPLLPAYTDASFSSYVFRSKDDFDKIPVFVVKYKLPAGFKCDHCILHWYWLTGNTCNPSCEKSDPMFPKCDRQNMGYCGEAKDSLGYKYPEEFWSCADIAVA